MLPRLPLGFEGRDHKEILNLVSFLPSTCGQYASPNVVAVQLVDADTHLGHGAKEGDLASTLHEEREREKGGLPGDAFDDSHNIPACGRSILKPMLICFTL